MVELILDKTVNKIFENLKKSTRSEDKKVLAEFIHILELLEENGDNLNYPFSETIKGNYTYKNSKLKELRILKISYRLFYFIYENKIGVILQAEEKKTNKLNSKVFDNAYKKMKDWVDFLESEEE